MTQTKDELKNLKDRLDKLKNLKNTMTQRNIIINEIKELEEELKNLNPNWFRRTFKIGNKPY